MSALPTLSAKRIWLLSTLAGLLGGWIVTFWMKPEYRSEAVLLTNSPTELSREDIRRASHAVANQDELAQLIRNVNLYPDERTGMPAHDAIALMRRNLRISPGADVEGAEIESAVTISFVHADRFRAQGVVRELARRVGRSGAFLAGEATLDREALFPNQISVVLSGLGTGVLLGGLAALGVRIQRLQRRVKELEAK